MCRWQHPKFASDYLSLIGLRPSFATLYQSLRQNLIRYIVASGDPVKHFSNLLLFGSIRIIERRNIIVR